MVPIASALSPAWQTGGRRRDAALCYGPDKEPVKKKVGDKRGRTEEPLESSMLGGWFDGTLRDGATVVIAEHQPTTLRAASNASRKARYTGFSACSILANSICIV